jgi:uridine kinase
MKARPKLVALVGGSGAGKTWLARQLQHALDFPAARLSLDDFYRDQSHLARPMRDRLNFDHPRAIDWHLAEAVLRGCRAGRFVSVPQYSFATHTRRPTFKTLAPRQVILVDGLWLLWRPRLRRLFDLRIFLHCPARLRLDRRLARDTANRGRDDRSVRWQFQQTVAPMHQQFVAPQARWADVVLRRPADKREVERLAAMIREVVYVSPSSVPRPTV